MLALTFLMAGAAPHAVQRAPANPPARGLRVARLAIIGYLFAENRVIDPTASAHEGLTHGTSLSVAAGRLTHIDYAFANVRDGRVVEGFAHDTENLRILTGLRRVHPGLKVLVSVGGWTWSGGFSDAAATPASRRRFAASAVAFVKRHDLDGLDIDWEYPGLPGLGNPHRPEDKAHFTALMQALRAAFDRAAGRHYVLTFAAGAFADFVAHTDLARVQRSVDYVNLMTYDFREADEDRITGHHANLFTTPADAKHLSVDGAVRAFLAAGVPARKLVVGVPFYGRGWARVAPHAHGLYQTGHPIVPRMDLGYGALAAGVIGRGGFTRFWDAHAQAPYLWNAARRVFISYDDPESLRIKARYIRRHGLGGAMFWQYYDDPSGALLRALETGLHDQRTPAR